MSYTLPHDKRLPLYQRLRDEIAARIAAQQWRADEAIPTEFELVRLYGVSIGTVRKAIDLLVSEGILERFQGRGTFVRRPQFDNSLFRFFRFQNEAGVQSVPDSRILARDAEPAADAVAQALRLPPGARVIHLLRQRLYGRRPFLVEDIWLPFERFAPLAELELTAFGLLLYPLYDERCGQVVASARETLTVAAAGEDDAALLDAAPGVALALIERTALGYDGRPLEFRRSRGLAERFKYHIEIK